MIITKMALPRRTFLRGVGAALALPLLDAMVPALTPIVRTAALPARRLGFFYVPNGAMVDERWTPSTVGANFELTPILQSLQPVKSNIVVVSGLCHKSALPLGDGNGDHPRGSATWLNGVHPKKTESSSVRAGITIDQIAAAQFGKDTPLASLELGLDGNQVVGACDNGYSCIYLNTLSWRTPTQPLPVENNPGVVFERMFGDGGTVAQRRLQMRNDRSLLDSVQEQLATLQKGLGPADRTTVNEYVESVREVELRIQKAERNADTTVPPDRPFGIPLTFAEHIKLMFDLQVLAYQADLTRVVTFQIAREISGRTYPEIGVTQGHHGISHHGNDPVKKDMIAKVNTYHVSLFSEFLQRLQATPDGDGSLLDHSLFLYGSGLGDGNGHTHFDLPVILAGGAGGTLKGGRHLKYPEAPMTNLLLSMLDKVGVPAETLGDSTGRIDLDTLSDL
jgi:hypothetical protein